MLFYFIILNFYFYFLVEIVFLVYLRPCRFSKETDFNIIILKRINLNLRFIFVVFCLQSLSLASKCIRKPKNLSAIPKLCIGNLAVRIMLVEKQNWGPQRRHSWYAFPSF